eukprot:CAMPEP_0169142460 /NCGR_PEP_ID=MMETSP1015-20121227/44975_1 /TAXON_ID=342587 /ORGANISM="Karlodinium micrum, Strain CCMP2283" /LENGTH=349 /DNA_ID=CAMNT_0009209155 /DNA_START=1 /DNA_END=1050 /DNA_ORIENTATION=+
MDLQEEMVAATLRKHFRELDGASNFCCVADDHVRCQTLATLTGRSALSSKLRNHHLGLIGMYGSRSPILEVIRKPAELEEDALLVRCRQCGDMISGDIDAIDEHSLICLAVKCRLCGERMNADVRTIEAHSNVCVPIVEQLSTLRYQQPRSDSTAGCQELQVHPYPYPYPYSQPVPRPVVPARENQGVASALLDISAANHARISQYVTRDMHPFPAKTIACSNDDFLRMEVRRQIEELHRLQQPLAPSQRSMQIVVENRASSNASQTQENGKLQEHSLVPMEQVNTWWREFLASPTNRVALFATINLSLLFARDYLSHRNRMTELQYRMDANLFLRFQQVVASQLLKYL